MREIVFEIIVLLVSAFCEFSMASESTTVSSEQIANMLPICQRNDPELNKCLLNATETLRDQILNGIPELGVPSLNPLKLPSVKLQQSTETLDYKAILTDVKIFGLGDYYFYEILPDFENMTLEFSALFNHVYVDAEYMLMGTYESLPVEGSGNFMANFTQNSANIKIYGAIVKRKDQDFLVNKDIVVSVKVGDAETEFENLYTGGEVKSQITDHIIKMHHGDILKQLKPAVENVISIIVDDITTKFFKSLPYDQLLPNN